MLSDWSQLVGDVALNTEVHGGSRRHWGAPPLDEAVRGLHRQHIARGSRVPPGLLWEHGKGKALVRRVQARAPDVAQCILAVAGASFLRSTPQRARHRGATL